jgi:hypothetical protein
MMSINSALRGLFPKRSNLVARMRRVSLGITVYLIWEERNKRVFDAKSREVDVMFRRFQILFYTVFHFHEQDHLQWAVGWLSGFSGSSFCCVYGYPALWAILHGLLGCIAIANFACFVAGLSTSLLGCPCLLDNIGFSVALVACRMQLVFSWIPAYGNVASLSSASPHLLTLNA